MKKTLIFLIPFVFFVYAIYTIKDYGINWDEPYHFRRGQAFLQYFLTGKKDYSNIPRYPALKGTSDDTNFRDSEKHFQEVIDNPDLVDPTFRRSYYQNEDWNGEYHIDIEDPYGHPALNGVLAAIFNKVFYQKLGILGDLESYHFFEISIVGMLIFSIAYFMWKEFGIIESISSSLVLSTYPLLLGEQHFNIKDPIVASFYSLTLISFYLFVKRKKFYWCFLSTIFFAIGLSTKFNIIFIAIPIFIWTFFYFYKNKKFIEFIKKFWPFILLSPLIIFIIFIGSFPTLWKNPFWGINRIVDYYLQVGYSIPSQPSKYYFFNFINIYPVTWIFYTTPIPTIFITLSSLFFVKYLFKNRSFLFLLILSLISIIGRISFFGALSYGGVRLIMEYIPILAMFCGIITGIICKKTKINIFVLIIIIILIFIPTLINLVNIHPNENVFFNKLIGGLAGAKIKELDSWGNSNGNAYLPAIEWLNKNAEPDAKLTIPVGSISNIPRFKLRPDISLSADYWSGPKHNGEYVIELTYDYTPMEWYSLKYLNTVMNPLYEVKVDGVAIAKLWENSIDHVKPEYLNEKEILGSISPNKNTDILEISFPTTNKIMQLKLTQPISNCNPLKTGYIDTSIDGKTWVRETEDIARDQIKHSKLFDFERDYTFYFVARKTKYIRLHTDDQDACILKAYNPRITVLEDN